MKILFFISLLAFISVWGISPLNARAANSPMYTNPGNKVSPISDRGFPADFWDHNVKDCIETCQLQGDYDDDQGYGEEQFDEPYQEQLEEPYEEEPVYEDRAEEQYDDDYGDPGYGDEVYPEEEPFEEGQQY